MTPEVYKGAEFTTTADLYALGIILYKFLNNNRIPFLPYYPEPFTPKQRNEALVRRLKGEDIALPYIAYVEKDLIKQRKENQEVGINVKEEELPFAIEFAKIAQKAINPNPNKRFPSAKELKYAIQKLELLYRKN